MEPIVTKKHVAEAVAKIREAAGDFAPEVGIVLGSGMGQMGEAIANPVFIPYAEVPHMVPSTCSGHVGRFILGELQGKRVICMQGRLHAYEGNCAQQIAFPIYVMQEMGISTVILTNAAGGIRPEYGTGDLMIISDHINFQSMNPVIGMPAEMGPRFFDMTMPYAPQLRELAKESAQERGLTCHEGVYIGDLGPSFETAAEIRAFRAMGADAVGMSTVQEVIAANQLGIPVLGISLISNPAAGVNPEPLDMSDVEKAAAKGAAAMQSIIEGVLAKLK